MQQHDNFNESLMKTYGPLQWNDITVCSLWDIFEVE